MFRGAISLNQDISNWDVSSVTDMSGMFASSFFYQPIGKWNVVRVGNMYLMFYYAAAFNQPIGNWNITAVEDIKNMFTGVTLSTTNYDATLLGWSGQIVQNGVVFSGGNSQYTSPSVARDTLINTYGWTITDGGTAP